MHEGVLTPPFFKEFRGGAGIPDSSYDGQGFPESSNILQLEAPFWLSWSVLNIFTLVNSEF